MTDPQSGTTLISQIIVPGHTVPLDEPALGLYEQARRDAQIREYFVLDEQGRPAGLLTRQHLVSAFGGLYGYGLHSRSTAARIMSREFLCVDEHTSISDAAIAATKRPMDTVYDAIAVTREGRYLGELTIRDLLLAFVQVRVRDASDVNPLTLLPGNRIIQQRIESCLEDGGSWSIIYIDLDNFKAFNDAYGFPAGDRIILSVAEAMRQSFPEGTFLGHIGGDDFVAISDREDVQPFCEELCRSFRRRILPLYTREDRERGYIISHDRSGFVQRFAIITLSVAVMSSDRVAPSSMEEMARVIADTKKLAKQVEGDAIIRAEGQNVCN